MNNLFSYPTAAQSDDIQTSTVHSSTTKNTEYGRRAMASSLQNSIRYERVHLHKCMKDRQEREKAPLSNGDMYGPLC